MVNISAKSASNSKFSSNVTGKVLKFRIVWLCWMQPGIVVVIMPRSVSLAMTVPVQSFISGLVTISVDIKPLSSLDRTCVGGTSMSLM